MGAGRRAGKRPSLFLDNQNQIKAATEIYNGESASFKEMLGVNRESQDCTPMSRSFSMINNPDSPSEAVRNGKLKEDLRKRYQKEALQTM